MVPDNVNFKSAKEGEQSCVKLTEIGPRLDLSLAKIEDGICAGEVLYHDTVVKAPEEVEKMREKKEEER